MPEKQTKYRAEVGARLRTAREALGLNQGELAAILGVGANAVSQYEKGSRRLDPELAVRLRKAHGVTLDYLFADEPAALPRDLHVKIVRPRLIAGGQSEARMERTRRYKRQGAA